MIILHRLDEDKLESLFWKFDTERKRFGAERDAFKHAMRVYACYHLDRAGVTHDIKIEE